MDETSLRRRLLTLLLVVVAVVGVGAGLYFLIRGKSRNDDLPPRGSAIYKKYVRAFQVGLVALEAGLSPAEGKLREATELIPGEPAGWANLALLHLRRGKQNELEEAKKYLDKAAEWAKKSGTTDRGEIDALYGVLYLRDRGQYRLAIKHFETALTKDPRNAVFAMQLANAIDLDKPLKTKPGYQANRQEYRKAMEKVLEIYPKNLPALVNKAEAEIDIGEMDGLRATLDKLQGLSAGWPNEARTALDNLRSAVEKSDKRISDKVRLLRDKLSPSPAYQQDGRLLALDSAVKQLGNPVWCFLRLEPLRSTPAPPDMELTFSVKPRPGGPQRSHWNVVRLRWQLQESSRDKVFGALIDVFAPSLPASVMESSVVLANASEVQQVGGGDQKIAFPGKTGMPPSAAGVLAVDFNHDYRQDLVLTGAGGIRFWSRKPGNGVLVDVTDKTKLPAAILDGDYYGAWAADIDRDGDLDLIVARRDGPVVVLRNNGDGTFKEMDTFASVKGARAFAWADLGNDGASDAAFLDADGGLHVFANLRHGQFERWPDSDNLGKFLALTAADINDDGVLDLVALRQDGMLVRISEPEHEPGQRKPLQVTALIRWEGDTKVEPGAATLFAADLDNNGALDLIVAGPHEAHVYLADDKGQFNPLGKAIPIRVTLVHDVDGDGRLDLLGVSAEGEYVAAMNQGKKAYHHNAIYPVASPKGAGDSRVNTHTIGSEVELLSGMVVQKRLVDAPVVHFGLGEENEPSVARIVWTNGEAQWEIDLPSDKLIVMGQRLGGSCPFLFTYDGKEMQFVGDFMWNTPLGMHINGISTGPVTQTTEWLKIRGDLLVPRDGYYDVRVHANLRETDYFDQLALIVVDHPPGTEIHVDESFSPDPKPPSLHVTTPAKPVTRAWDHKGQDVTDIVRAIDGIYLDHCGRGKYQGVTVDHWVEVDLGEDAPREGPVWLIARGWTHPTDSSINFALEQGQHDMPRLVSLEVPDGKGGWKVGRPALGFPAGKNKTMLVRLDGIEGTGIVSRRFRLRTNLEVFWDFLGYATELDPKLAKLHRPEMLAADLRYKGILQMVQKDKSSPELPVYNEVSHGQPWRDLTGFYTRYGDVRELLAKVDDRYVIMNAGDEIGLRFAVPEPPPAGWVRDFVWECDGWTRDGNPNTQYGTTVLPLPAHDLKELKLFPGGLQADPVYQSCPKDWEIYHTRYVTPDRFAQGLRVIFPSSKKK
jgi:tetratricopeptide (TPR) repeat protein